MAPGWAMFSGMLRGAVCLAMIVTTCDGYGWGAWQHWWGGGGQGSGWGQQRPVQQPCQGQQGAQGWQGQQGSGSPASAAPTIAFATPQDGAHVFGTISIRANVSVSVDPAVVDFTVDGNDLGTASSAPYALAWQVPSSGSSFLLGAQVTDGQGRTAYTQVLVYPDSGDPTIAFQEPTSGATVSGKVSVYAMTSDTARVTSVQYLVDGASIATVSPGDTVTWDTVGVSNGSHMLEATAVDAVGNRFSAQAGVTVSNGGGAFTVTITSPVNGVDVSGTTTVTATANDSVPITKVEFSVDSSMIGGRRARLTRCRGTRRPGATAATISSPQRRTRRDIPPRTRSVCT